MAPRYTLMAVHAHPDDESSLSSGMLAECAAARHEIVVVTCTGGELGEPGEPPAPTPEALRERRFRELREACAILGVHHVEWLGYPDSGVEGSPDNENPACFVQADLEEAAERLVRLIRRYRPHVLVTYPENGFYGHPDHIQANRVTIAAFAAAGDASRFPEAGPPWVPAKLYYAAACHSTLRKWVRRMVEAGLPVPPEVAESMERGSWGIADDRVTLVCDVRRWVDVRRRAIAAHRSQVTDTTFFLELPRDIFEETFGWEEYALAETRVPVALPEQSLFDGIPIEALAR